MYFPEYPSGAAGFHEPHVDWAGGYDQLERNSSRARGIAVCSFLSGVTLTVGGLLGAAAYFTSDHNTVPALVIGGFFCSTGMLFGIAARGLIRRLIGYIDASEFIISSQESTIRGMRQRNGWLRSRLAGAAAGESSGGSREGATLSPAANVYTLNSKRKEPFQ